jgi:CRP/FNR family transcriptional regulator, cyclic AMP receptor protein
MRTKARQFDPQTLLERVENGKTNVTCFPRKALFRQGDLADSIFYIQKGKVKLTVVSQRGKEAVVALLSAGDFLGEGCLAGEARRVATAIPLCECGIVRIDKAAAVRALQENSPFSELFLAYLLARNIRIQEDLEDHLFNSSEKRLARVLLQLAHFGKESQPDRVITKISQETLAEMIGTTRPRVNFFMNKFRKLGFIKYNGHLEVHGSLLSVVLHD